jgi:hypothetical protein
MKKHPEAAGPGAKSLLISPGRFHRITCRTL